MILHRVVLQELLTGISIPQSQDNEIVEEAGNLFQGYKAELDARSRRITNN